MWVDKDIHLSDNFTNTWNWKKIFAISIMDSISRYYIILPLETLKGRMSVWLWLWLWLCVVEGGRGGLLRWGVSQPWGMTWFYFAKDYLDGFVQLTAVIFLWKMTGKLRRFMWQKRGQRSRVNVICEMTLSSLKNFCKNLFYLVSAFEAKFVFFSNAS